MTLQQNRATESPARAKARTDTNDPCPEDCHYCSGPETD